MKKICCIKCNKYRKFKNPKLSFVFYKTSVFSLISDKCGNKHDKILKKEQSIEILNDVDLIDNEE